MEEEENLEVEIPLTKASNFYAVKAFLQVFSMAGYIILFVCTYKHSILHQDMQKYYRHSN